MIPGLEPFSKLMKDNPLAFFIVVLWFIAQMTGALTSSAPTVTVINNNNPTIVNKVTIEKSEPAKTEATPRDRGVYGHGEKHSKRKQRRLRGKAKEEARRTAL